MTSTVVEVEKQLSFKQSEQKDHLDLSQFTYTACYCEENVFLLCKQLSQRGIAASDASDLYVVFISNAHRQIPIWRQKASSRDDGLAIWDYHVICVQAFHQQALEAVVWDFDTALQLPVSFSEYVNEAFRTWVHVHSRFNRLYRVVAAPLYLKYFASDRRHMRTLEGFWKMPPPLYECIIGEDGSSHNLEDYITMSEERVSVNKLSTKESLGKRLGAVLTEQSLLDFFGSC